MVNKELLYNELLISKKENKLTEKAERLCLTLINNMLDKYEFYKNLEEYKENAIEACKCCSLQFNEKKFTSNISISYIVTIIKGSFASTYLKIKKRSKKHSKK